MDKIKKQGFTLVELLIVVAIIAILAAVVFAALNPLKRFQDSRNARRWSDIAELMHAIKVYQVDNGGTYLTAIEEKKGDGYVYMITQGLVSTGCASQNSNCVRQVTGDTYCVNLGGLVSSGYMGKIPISPNGAGIWTSVLTGYTLVASSTGVITITACEAEGNSPEISVTR